MTIKFEAPEATNTKERMMLSVTSATHEIVNRLAHKHGISMTKFADAMARYHDQHNEV